MLKTLSVGVGSLLAGALALSACDLPGPAPKAAEWIPIAQTTEGGQVSVAPASIAVDAAAGVTDVAIKVTYPNAQSWTVDTPSYVEQKWFNAERITLRFDCAARRYAIVSREALDAKGDVKETVKPPLPEKAAFLEIKEGGLAAIAVGRACPA